MSLLFKPHTVTIKKRGSSTDPTTLVRSLTGNVDVLYSGIACHIYPEEDATVQLDPETREELKNPHILLTEPKHAAKFSYGLIVVDNLNRVFTVKGKPDQHVYSLPADHAMVVMEQLEFI